MSTSNESGLAQHASHSNAASSNDALLARSVGRLRRLLSNDPDVDRAHPSPEALEAISKAPTTIEAIEKAFELYADRPCLGERAFELTKNGVVFLPTFREVSYADLWARIQAFASGLRHDGLASPGSFVGICGFGSIDWVVADLSCIYLAAVSVPLQTGMSPADLQQIIREADLSCMACSVEQLDLIEGVVSQCPSIRSIVVLDVREGDVAAERKLAQRKRALEAGSGGVRVVRTMKEVEAIGRAKGIVPKVLPASRAEADPLMTLAYTSGSTGVPKGAIVRESLLKEQWQSGFFSRLAKLLPHFPQMTVNYMPLNHSAGRGSIDHAIVRGGISYFIAKSDMSTLFEDIRLARPTTLLLVPRVAEAIYRHFQTEVARRSAETTDDAEREKIADRVMAEMRTSYLGDRLLFVTTGTAPTPPDVVAFIKRCFEIPVIDGYGSTEAGPITFDGKIDPEVGITWRLVDVPELGYRTSDRPYPRGELHVKSKFLVPGYYKNERATNDLFDEQGYMNMGDIVEQRAPDQLIWIDRAKNILKLSQGEFVATSKLEGLYTSGSSLIRQIYVYGNSLRAYVLAVVVPTASAEGYLRRQGVEPSESALKQVLRSEINRVAVEYHLHGYEIPRDFIVEREPFTIDNGLLTVSSKPARAKLRARYGERLEALYGDIERAQVEELYGLRGERGTTSVAEKVKKAMEVTLGLPDIDVDGIEQSFSQLGGDSLSAVGLETLIEEIVGVRVPIGFLLDRTNSVRSIVEFVETSLAGGGKRNASFDEIHGKGSTSVRAADLRIDRFFRPEEFQAAVTAQPRPKLSPRARVALLTGANGFLGRFLTLELLDRLEGEGTRLYAIVRAPSDVAAAGRLARSYQTDPALRAKFQDLSTKGRLCVLAGDLMKPSFGLADDVYEKVAAEVDLVVHNGALVNHAFSYEQLFEPNVIGTTEMIRFALAGKHKSISYVSTVGVASGLRRTEPLREDEDVRSFFTERPSNSGYAVGYGTSKWASELLLRDAHDKLGLSVAVFRPSGIMTHRRYRGQVNAPDFFTRWLVGLVDTGVAPQSFYSPSAPDRAKHYDGEPVDIVARSIAAVSVDRQDQGSEPFFETYHVVNPHHDDGISLDVIVGWLMSAEYPLERMANYDQWYRTFHDRLTALTETQKQESPLPILKAWEHPLGERALSFDAARLVTRLGALSPSYAELPHVDEPLIHKYLDDMALLGLIAPRKMRRTGS